MESPLGIDRRRSNSPPLRRWHDRSTFHQCRRRSFEKSQSAPAAKEVLYRLSVSALTPGNSLPSRNSRDAPPPVEICEILSATPAAVTAETESPPPTIDVAPALSATARASLNVPLAKAGISNTP